MFRHLRITLAFCVAAFLAAASVTSAAQMAPDREAHDRASYELTYGMAAAAALCGTDLHHDHDCPYCHGLPEPSAPRFDPVAQPLVAVDGWRLAAQRHRAAQARNINHSPRAPPRWT